jgi:hypothetical protein
MALKSYPETPAEEAARINRQSGDPDGITAEQVANNRKLNESLTAGFGFSGTGASISPFATLVSQVSSQVQAATSQVESKLPAESSFLGKTKLDGLIDRASGAVGTGLNGATAGATSLLDSARGVAGGAGAALAGIGSRFKTAVQGGASTLQSAVGGISNVTADISGTLNKLTGGNLAGGFQQAAGAISGAAGQLNNILSLFRGSNLPAGAELFTQQSSPVKLSPNNKDDWRVKIDTNWALFGANDLFTSLALTGGVVFPYLPTITVATRANYTQVDPVHNNYPFQAYKNSQVDEITIAGEFSCETAEDAAYWISATTFFKTATKMFFGNSANAGNPPIICRLTGYGASIFNNVPVVIKSFSVDLKDDVNYIKCNLYATNTWVPTLSTITIVVAPVYNRTNLRQFKIEDYATGGMVTNGGAGYI